MERRTFLVLGASLLGVAGCTTDADSPEPTPTRTSPPPARDPDAGLRGRVAAAEIALIARYRTTIADHPELADSIGAFLAHHEAHLQRVAPGTPIPPADVPTDSGSDAAPTTAPGTTGPTGAPNGDASASATSSAPPSPASSSSPAPADEQVLALAELERDARRSRLSDCDAASSGVLARDLCLIAASEAQHAELLGRLGAAGRS